MHEWSQGNDRDYADLRLMRGEREGFKVYHDKGK
jgi:hypothetical protein